MGRRVEDPAEALASKVMSDALKVLEDSLQEEQPLSIRLTDPMCSVEATPGSIPESALEIGSQA